MYKPDSSNFAAKSKIGLCSLSIDALALITSKLSAHSICKLYITGYQELITMLKVGGVDSFNLKYERLLPRFMRWPQLITQFQKLRNFEVEYVHSDSFAYVKDIDLMTIPKSVQSISVSRGTDAFISLCFTDKTNLDEFFPNLRHLYIPDTTWTTYPEKFLKFLPSSLVSLHTMFQFEPNDLELLPSSLTDLSINMKPVQELRPQDKLEFPKNLTKLAFLFAPSYDFVASLPISMMDLTISFSWHANKDLETIAFPPYLTSLRFKCPNLAPDSLFYKLPSTLTLVSIEQEAKWEGTPHAWYFPPNITSLQLRPQFDMITVRSSRSLTVETDVEGRYSSFFAALPRTLKTLDVFLNQRLTPSLLQLLPKTLTSVPNLGLDTSCDMLDCPMIDQIVDPTDLQLSQLVPPKARCDAHQYYVPQLLRPLVNTIQRPSANEVNWTYFSLTKIEFSRTSQPSASHATLLKHFPSLKELHGLSLSVLHVKDGTVRLSQQLPHTLQSLKLIDAPCVDIEFNSESNNEFSSLQVLDIEGNRTENEAQLLRLPPSLTDIAISALRYDLKPFTWKNLPELKSLVLYLGPTISGKCYPKRPLLSELPKFLKYLMLGLELPELTLQDLKDLPQELKVLKIPYQDNWKSMIPPTQESLSLLPPYLTRLHSNSNSHMVSQMPIAELLQTRRLATRTYTNF